MILWLGYIASLLIGIALGLLGGGGGILTVPTLHYLFNMNAEIATASSLVVVGITSLLGAAKAAHAKELDFRKGILFATPGFISVFLSRKFIVPAIPLSFNSFGLEFSRSFILMILFALVMLFSALAMFKKKSSDLSPKDSPIPVKSATRNILIQGFIVGGVTGLVGAGGGFLIVPALTILVGLPMRIAIGTSLFIIALNSAIGVLSSLSSGIIFDWQTLSIVASLSIFGMIVGLFLKQKITDSLLKKIFAWLVLLMAIFIFTKEILWLFKH